MAGSTHGVQSTKTLRRLTPYTGGREFQLLVYPGMGAQSFSRIYSWPRRQFCWRGQHCLAEITMQIICGKMGMSPPVTLTRIVVGVHQELKPRMFTWSTTDPHNSEALGIFRIGAINVNPISRYKIFEPILSKVCHCMEDPDLLEPVRSVMSSPIPGCYDLRQVLSPSIHQQEIPQSKGLFPG